MTETRKIQGEIALTDNTAAAFASVKSGARDMAQGVTQAAGQAGAAISGMGAGADGAAAKVDRATGNMIASVQRATAAMKAGQRGTADYFEEIGRQRGVSADALRPYIEQLRAAERAQALATGGLGKMQVSAAQTAAALRLVPAQFTDIVTSIASGQAPLTVLLQQGGQLKDSFGGAGAAARALGGYVLGLINPYTVLAGVAVGVTAAFVTGAKEAEAYGRAIILSGNAAGVTTGQLTGMAQRLAAVAGTQGAAAEAIAQVAQSGAVGSRNLEGFTAAALRYAKATGESVGDVVKALDELSRSPADAALKLNERYRFLTASTYEQVKALEEAGKKTEAADLAQKAFADTIESRSGAIVANLGLIERAWNKIGGAVKGAIDKAKDVGRDATPEALLGKLQATLAARQAEPFKFGSNPAQVEAGNIALGAQIAALAGVIEGQRQTAQATAAARKEQDAGVAATERAAKTAERFADKQTQLNKALKEYRDDLARIRAANPNSAQLDPALVARTEAGIRKQFTEAPTAVKADPFATEVARSYATALADLGKIAADVAGKTDGLSKAQQRLQAEMASPVFAAYSRQQQEQIVYAASLAQAEEDRAEAMKKAATVADQRAQALKAQRDSDDAAARAIVESATAAARSAEEAARLAQFEASTYGLTKSAVLELHLAEKERSLDALASGSELYQLRQREIEALKRQIAAVRGVEVRTAADAQAKEVAEAYARAAEQIEGSITDALMRGFESGKGFAEVLRDTVVNMFKTLVLRPVVSAVVQPVASGITSALGAPSGIGGFGTSAAGNYAGNTLFANGIFGSSAAYGAAIGTTSIGAGSQAAMLAAQTGVFGAEGAALTAAAAGNAAVSTVLTAMPYLAIAAFALTALAKSGETRQGAGYQVNNGVALLGGGPSGGAIDRALETRLVQTTYDSINATLKALGSSITVASFQAGLESSTKGRGATFAGGSLSSGAAFGQTYDPALYTQTLTPEQAAQQFGDKLARAQLEALKAAADTLPAYVKRALDTIDPSALSASDAAQAVAALVSLPATLLQQAGLARDALVQSFAQGLLTGDAARAGQSVADQVVAGIRQAMVGGASAEVFDILNRGVIAPFIDAAKQIATNQATLDIINSASVDAAIEQAVQTAAALGTVLNDPRVTTALDSLRTRLGDAFGRAGAGINVPPSFLVATAADAATTNGASAVASTAEAEARRVADSLKTLQTEGRQLQAQLLGLQGHSAAAKAALRALATEGLSQVEIAAYDANEGIRAQIAEYERLAQQRSELLSLIGNAYSAADTFLTGAQARAFKLEVLARQFVDAGASGSVADYLQIFANVDDAGIKSFVQQFLLLPGATLAAKQAVLSLGQSLLDISAQREATARSTFDRSVAAERTLLEARAAAARETIAQAESITNAARNAQRDLLGQGSTGAFATAQARAFLQSSLVTLRASGYLPDPAKVADAIGQSVRGLDEAFYRTQADAEYARVVLAGTLGELGDASAGQLDTARAQLKAAEQSAKNLDSLVQQMSGLAGILAPLPQAIQELAAAMALRGTLPDVAKTPALLPYLQPISGPDLLPPISTPGPVFAPPVYLPINGPDLPGPISTPGPVFPTQAPGTQALQAEMAGLRQSMQQLVALQEQGNGIASRTASNTDPNVPALVEVVT